MIEPIHRSITVHRTPDEAFRLFTTQMGSWWPLDTHGRAEEHEGTKTERLVFEERAGGRIYEVLSNGLEADWGIVTAWEPPGRVEIDWNPSPEDRPYTEVEVTFTPAGDGGTRVDLFHRHWERLGDELATTYRENYDTGWAYVFDDRFGAAAG
ncbi:MAG: SRPBCC domain-containing protein [Actinomycetota bacterium]